MYEKTERLAVSDEVRKYILDKVLHADYKSADDFLRANLEGLERVDK